MFGLYLHVPYCEGKCYYCDFYAQGGSRAAPEAYVDALLREMRRFSSDAPLRPDTLYFGGGTPSLLTPAQTARLIDAAAPPPQAEITLEANPGTVSLESLRAYRSAGVNRLSLGVQTARDASLLRLGRRHTAAQSREALAWATAAGFSNVSGDVMLALPHYTLEELDETLALLSEGGCTHVSSYLLKIEPRTVFGKRPPEGLPDDDAAADFYLACVERLAARGYAQYEISNFAKPGFASRHNCIYWTLGEYLGLGPAAHSCLRGKRFATAESLRDFLAGPASYEPQGTVDAEDFVLLRLRLTEGLSLRELERQWGVRWTPEKRAFCARLAREGMARFDGERLSLLPRGMLIQNSILCELL